MYNIKIDIKRKLNIACLKMRFKCVHAFNQPQVFRQRVPEGRPRAQTNGGRTTQGCDAARKA